VPSKIQGKVLLSLTNIRVTQGRIRAASLQSLSTTGPQPLRKPKLQPPFLHRTAVSS